MNYTKASILFTVIYFSLRSSGSCDDIKRCFLTEIESCSTENSPGSGVDFQTTVGYWNDNFIHDDIFGEDISEGGDDYVTASFWFQLGFEKTRRWLLFDVYHNILTNKSQAYRTDLLTCRFSIEGESRFGIYQGGIGVIANGDYGGEKLQNTYHRITGARRLDLGYVSRRETGLVIYTRIEPVLRKYESFVVKGYAANSYRSGVGPSNVRAGLEAAASPKKVQNGCIFHLRARGGFIGYYLKDKYLSPLFDRGFTWSTMVSMGRIDRWNGSFWVTGNQYGRNNPHFGISWTFGWNGTRMGDLSDITYP